MSRRYEVVQGTQRANELGAEGWRAIAVSTSVGTYGTLFSTFVMEREDPAPSDRAEELSIQVARILHPDDECRYDHHDYCQTHNLHERPCPYERLREILGDET